MNNNSKLESSKSPPLRAIINGQEIACELETLDLHLDGLWLVGTIGGIPFKVSIIIIKKRFPKIIVS